MTISYNFIFLNKLCLLYLLTVLIITYKVRQYSIFILYFPQVSFFSFSWALLIISLKFLNVYTLWNALCLCYIFYFTVFLSSSFIYLRSFFKNFPIVFNILLSFPIWIMVASSHFPPEFLYQRFVLEIQMFKIRNAYSNILCFHLRNWKLYKIR